VAGAARFLSRQRGVDPGRIAALGLSMGAEEALRAAAEGVPLAAVVADGAGASTGGDKAIVHSGAPSRSVNWLGMRATELFSGDEEPKPLIDEGGAIHTPVLLIASNAPDELALDRAYRQRIGGNARLWRVPDASHTKALERHPAAYSARVAGVLGAP
jgi:dienelactone hydrolase